MKLVTHSTLVLTVALLTVGCDLKIVADTPEIVTVSSSDNETREPGEEWRDPDFYEDGEFPEEGPFDDEAAPLPETWEDEGDYDGSDEPDMPADEGWEDEGDYEDGDEADVIEDEGDYEDDAAIHGDCEEDMEDEGADPFLLCLEDGFTEEEGADLAYEEDSTEAPGDSEE